MQTNRRNNDLVLASVLSALTFIVVVSVFVVSVTQIVTYWQTAATHCIE